MGIEDYLTKEVKRLLRNLREEFYLAILLYASENPLIYKPRIGGFTVPQLKRVAEDLGLSEYFVAKTAYRVFEKQEAQFRRVKCTEVRGVREYEITKAGTDYIREYIRKLWQRYETRRMEPWLKDRYDTEVICMELRKRKKNILVIGDVMLDHVLYGLHAGFTEVQNHGLAVFLQESVTESYVAPARIASETYSPGGAAWLARSLVEVADVALCGILGSREVNKPDREGERLIQSLQGKVNFKYVLADEAPTICKNYFFLPKKIEPRVGYTGIRVDREDRKLMYQEVESLLGERILAQVKRIVDLKLPDAIVIDDYEKGTVSSHILKEIISLAPDIPLFVDPKYGWHKFKGIQISAILPNVKEALFGSGLSEEEVKARIDRRETVNEQDFERLVENFPQCKDFIVKADEHGATILTYEMRKRRHKPRPIKPVDARGYISSIGCGGVFDSLFISSRLHGFSSDISAILANFAGGLKTTKPLGIVLSVNEILNQIQEKSSYFQINWRSSQ